MLVTDKDALVCDFAETYHVFDWRALPLSLTAVLAAGLRETSRIKMRLMDISITPDTALLAGIADRLSLIAWLLSEDGRKGTNRPPSILDKLLRGNGDRETVVFDSPKSFEEERARILGKRRNRDGN